MGKFKLLMAAIILLPVYAAATTTTHTHPTLTSAQQLQITLDKQMLAANQTALNNAYRNLYNDELYGNASEIRADRQQIATLKGEQYTDDLELHEDGGYIYASRSNNYNYGNNNNNHNNNYFNGWGDHYNYGHHYNGWDE